MLAEVLLERNPRSVSEISAPQLIAPITLLAAVLLRRDRPPLVPVVGVESGVFVFENSLINSAGVVTLENDSPSPGLNKVYGTNASGTRGWRDETGGVGGGAPVNAHYVVTTVEPGLTNPFNLASLGSGITKQTVSGGVATPGIAVSGTDYVGPGDSRLSDDRTANALRTASVKPIDVTADPTDGQLLAYDATSGKWKPVSPAAASSIATALQTLTVKSIDNAVDPIDGQLLSYNGVSGKWQPKTYIRGFGFGASRSAGIAAGKLKGYFTCPYNGLITGWWLAIDNGEITVRFWKKAGAKPSTADNINTAGISLSGGALYLRSTSVADFTAVTVLAGDVFAVEVVSVVGTITDFSGALEITAKS